jgi:Succinyl-CoA ligase like flavodoxin domain/ATP-grasp domain
VVCVAHRGQGQATRIDERFHVEEQHMSDAPETQAADQAAIEFDTVLSDGGVVHIRQLRPDDADRLVAFGGRLSQEAIYRRWFNFHPQLSPAGVERLTTVNGLSSFVSAGNKADVSGNDLLQYWETDEATKVILLYLESFGNPRTFARLARRVSTSKPIIAIKSGRSAAARCPAASHTAAAATPDVAVDALFRQTGVIRVDTVDQLLDTAQVLAEQPALKADGPTLVHKTERGAVALGLTSQSQVRRAFSDMRSRLGNTMHQAIIQPMAPTGVETVVGVVHDPSFGPLVRFGLGGVATDLLGDRAFSHPAPDRSRRLPTGDIATVLTPALRATGEHAPSTQAPLRSWSCGSLASRTTCPNSRSWTSTL